MLVNPNYSSGSNIPIVENTNNGIVFVSIQAIDDVKAGGTDE